MGVAYDRAGNLFIADSLNARIRRISAGTGVITTFAGGGASVGTGDGGLATDAQLDLPRGVTVDAAGNVFIADWEGHRVRRVDAVTKKISTVAGTGVYGYSGDGGAATSAQLRSPFALAIDPAGNLFISDESDYRIRRVDAKTKVITTIAGTGVGGYTGDGGPAIAATFANPGGVAVDPLGNVLFVDQFNARVRRIDMRTGKIATIAGNGVSGFGGDGGPAIAAQIDEPVGIAFDPAGNLYISEYGNERVRRVSTTGIITTVAGIG